MSRFPARRVRPARPNRAGADAPGLLRADDKSRCPGTPSSKDRTNGVDCHDRRAGGLLRARPTLRIRHRRHRIPARDHLLAKALPAAGRDARRGGAGRSARRRPQPPAFLRAARQREDREGLPRRPAGHRNLRQALRQGARRTSSTPRSRPRSAASATASATTIWCARSPASSSTNPRASPTGRTAR